MNNRLTECSSGDDVLHVMVVEGGTVEGENKQAVLSK